MTKISRKRKHKTMTSADLYSEQIRKTLNRIMEGNPQIKLKYEDWFKDNWFDKPLGVNEDRAPTHFYQWLNNQAKTNPIEHFGGFSHICREHSNPLGVTEMHKNLGKGVWYKCPNNFLKHGMPETKGMSTLFDQTKGKCFNGKTPKCIEKSSVFFTDDSTMLIPEHKRNLDCVRNVMNCDIYKEGQAFNRHMPNLQMLLPDLRKAIGETEEKRW